MAEAYDGLIDTLKSREELIERRIKDQIAHLGVEERILFEDRDFSREFETVKNFDDPFNNNAKAEEILSVSE